MPYIELERHRRRRSNEFLSVMAVIGDDGDYATDLAGQQVQERFSAPRIYRGMLRDEDLNPEHEASHRMSASYVITRMQLGRAGRFTIGDTGKFKDFHGGAGIPGPSAKVWFTPEALRRGIGWTFVQRYYLDGRHIGSFHVSRIITNRSDPYQLDVIKRRV